jgi:hypothetical protein
MGHINICGNSVAELATRFVALAQLLPSAQFPEVADVATKLQQQA